MTATAQNRIRVFDRAGLRFPTEDLGPIDGEPVLLLHGWPQDARSWDRLVPLLVDQGYRVLAPTLRGATPEANPSSRWAYRSDELLADATAMIERIGGPVHLVGHDWGAAMAWTTAARRPDLVRTLTAVSVPHPAAFLAGMRRPRQLAKSWYMAFFQLPFLPELVLGSAVLRTRVLRGSGQAPHVAARDGARLESYALRRGGLNWYRGAALTRVRDMGGPSTVPTLQVWSDQDVAVARETVEGSARYVQAPYRLLALDGVSHWIPDAAPEQLASALVAHFDRREPAADVAG